MNLFKKKQLTSNDSRKEKGMFSSVYKLINKIISPEGEEQNGQCTVILAGAEALYMQKGMQMNNAEFMWPFDIKEQLELKLNYEDIVKKKFMSNHKGFSFDDINNSRSDLYAGLMFTVNNMKELKHLDMFQQKIFVSFLEEDPNELPNIILYVLIDYDRDDDWFTTYEAEELFTELSSWGYDKKNIHVVWPINGFFNRKAYNALGLLTDGGSARSLTKSAMGGAKWFSQGGSRGQKVTKRMDGCFVVIPDTGKMDEYTITKKSGMPFRKYGY